MSRVLYFATSSSVKFHQYQVIFRDLGISIRRGTAITSVLVEPQFESTASAGMATIVSHPLRQAARFVARMNQVPYMIEDTMLFIQRFAKDMKAGMGLPGADTKNWWLNLGSRGVLELIDGIKDRGAMYFCQIGLYLGGSHYYFSNSELAGAISDRVRVSELATAEVPRSNPFYFHEIFIPSGSDLTLAEMSGDEFSKFDYRRRCAVALVQQLGNDIGSWPIDVQLEMLV